MKKSEIKLLVKLREYTKNTYSKEMENKDVAWGLCSVVAQMERIGLISLYEYHMLYMYIRLKKPLYKPWILYGWMPGKLKPRLNWLRNRIIIEIIKNILDMGKNQGMLVKTKSNLYGRTYNHKPEINGKTAVYIYDMSEIKNMQNIEMTEVLQQPFMGNPLLCETKTLTFIGYID